MINESTQDPNKPLRRPSPFDKDSSLNFLAGPLIYETKDFEDINNNLPNFKTKGFANSNFGNYNSNLGFLNGYGHSMFGQLEKPDISPNLYLSDLNSNKKDISFSKKPIEYDFSNQFNYQHSRNLGPSNMMNPLLENNHFFQNSNNNPILFEESHFCDNEKNLKNLFSQNANKMNLNFEQNISMFSNKENSKRLLPAIGNLEEEPRYVNEKQYNRMMIRRIKRAKEILKSYRPHQVSIEKSTTKKRYKYESRHLHAAKRPRDSNGKFLKKEKLSQEQEDETNNEKAFSEELGRLVKDKRDSKKIRKTNASRNCKAVSDKIILKKTKDLEQSPKLPENNKEEINNESYFEDSNNMAASLNENSVIRMSNPQKVSLSQSEHLYEMDNDDKNVLNLNLSFIKKEEDG